MIDRTGVLLQGTSPTYRYQKGWIPWLLEDFGDGGAFPEVHMAQYPLDMGWKKKMSNALAIQEVKKADDPDLQRSDKEAIKEMTEKTRVALEKYVSQKVAMSVRAADKLVPAQYIRYMPSQQGVAFNSGAKHRVIRVVEVQKDPMEPPRFKIGKKIPWGPSSPPAPACEAVEMCAQIERKVAQKEKEKYEEKLREMAQKARERRAGIKTHVEKEDGEAHERDDIRYNRWKERQNDQNLSWAAPDKRSKLQRNENRDISEAIALGVPNPWTSNEVQHDQRLFNQSKGMDSGFAGGEDEIYNVYDQAWTGGKDLAQNIYRPSKNLDEDMYGDDLEARIKTNRFVPNKEFSVQTVVGKEVKKDQFSLRNILFGLDKFLEEAKQHSGSKRPSDSSFSKEHEHEGKNRGE
ncbi:hypothetical protein HJG60_010659 [Phyllostomus discolor]|uniref:SNW domain-containing protein 1 n=1 Tax=Phyllostomus discolor TaxID=89673 RepID=A0A834ASH9_9CHIR|nr:hypothetical protein HJG60_010659 [Phyllostomus discolor]